MITVYYDGKCNICSKEISYYKSISNKELFNWYDIANNPKYLKTINVTQSEALMQLHATDQNSQLYIGVDAFILIWKNLRFWKILSIIISLPIIKQISILAYKKFAKYRFSKLKHCQLSLKN